MSPSKKVFIASVVIFLSVFLFWGIYNLSFKKNNHTSTNKEKNATQTTIEKQNKIISISEEAVVSPIILSDGVTIRYYTQQKGHVIQVDLEGNNRKVISNKNLHNIKNITWSKSKERVLTKRIINEKKFFSYFDFQKEKGGSLSSNIESIDFQNENKIVYIYKTPNTKASLNIADFDGKNWKKLTDLDFYGQKIKPIPQTGLLSFWNYPDANYETKLYTIPLIGGEKKLIFKGKFGGDFIWNNNGSFFLASSLDAKNGQKINLGVFDFYKEKYSSLAIPTLVQKCAWSKDNKTLFYALPGSMPNKNNLPNDYLESKFNTVDTFWKVDIESGEKERLIELKELEQKIDATDLFLNNDESILFFTNRYDGKLYRMKL